MAKADFCFTYYDGDAARDMSHMNRLERGGYTDIIISQRKFGHLSLDQVKKILGRDFQECWPAIELVLKTDATGKFFIEWLESSEAKAKKHSAKQAENVRNRYQEPTNSLPTLYQTTPLEDGNEDGGGSETEGKGVQGENTDINLLLDAAFDERYMEELKMSGAFKNIDIDGQLAMFKIKVRGSPGDYLYHDAQGLRKAYNYQLRHTKPEKSFTVNGEIKRTAANAIIEPSAGFGKL